MEQRRWRPPQGALRLGGWSECGTAQTAAPRQTQGPRRVYAFNKKVTYFYRNILLQKECFQR